MPQLISAANSLADTCYQTDSHSSQSFTQMHGKTHPVPMLKIAFVSVHHHAAALSQVHHTESSDHKVHTLEKRHQCRTRSCRHSPHNVEIPPHSLLQLQVAAYTHHTIITQHPPPTAPPLPRWKLQEGGNTQCSNHQTTSTPNSSNSSSLGGFLRWKNSMRLCLTPLLKGLWKRPLPSFR